MKKQNYYAVLLIGLLSLATVGCKYFKGAPVGAINEVDSGHANRDSTIYGVCGRGTSMNSLQLIADTGDTLTLDTGSAQEGSQVFGGIKVGDRMAVVANADSSEAKIVINVSALLGDWVMEDPLDGNGEVGFCLKDGGAAESINYTNIIYQSWRLVNGKLQLINTRDDGGDFEERGLYTLKLLGPDTLHFVDEKEREDFGYSRPKPQETYNVDIDLDDDVDDYPF